MNIRTGERLAFLRSSAGLSVTELAEKLEVPSAAVDAWERGIDLPNTPSLIKLSKLYNVTVDSLVIDEEIEYASEAQPKERNWPNDNAGSSRDFQFKLGDTNVRIKRTQFPYPIIVTLAYMAAGFLFDWWHPAWMLFLTIPLYYTMPDFEKDGVRKALLQFSFPVLVTIVYLIIGFLLGWWHPWWMLYLTIPMYYIFVSNMDKD